MNEQEMYAWVGELSGRLGYPMPTLIWVDGGVHDQSCIQITPNPAGGLILTVHDHVGDFHSVEEQEILITQGFVQGRLGVERWPKRFRWIEGGSLLALCVVGGLVVGQITDNRFLALLGLLAALAIAYLLTQLVHVLLAFVMTRSLLRRSDRMLCEVIGRDRVVAWLTSRLGDPKPIGWRYRLRWLWAGSAPMAAERLRMLGEKVAAA